MDATPSTPVGSSGDASAASGTDSQSSITEKGDSKDGVKLELGEANAEIKTESKVDVKIEVKEEKIEVGKEGLNGGGGVNVKQEEQEDKNKLPMSADGIQRNEGDTQKLRYRNFEVFLLNDTCKTTAQRAKIIGKRLSLSLPVTPQL